MAYTPQTLLQEIDAFLSATGMGVSYFGKQAAGNSELVRRLRDGGRIWPETEIKVRAFMASHKRNVRNGGYGRRNAAVQGASA